MLLWGYCEGRRRKQLDSGEARGVHSNRPILSGFKGEGKYAQGEV